jgi:GNAT superfamily N-acetyltransferase
LDREPLGVVVYSRETDGNGLPGVWLRKIAVKPQYRRKGVGTLLLQAVTDFARSVNAVEIRLLVPETICYSDGVAKFLASIGMQCTECFKDQFEFGGEIEDGLLFKKVLRLT